MADRMRKAPDFELDRTDLALLDELQSDCKRSLAELGERVGLSAPAVHERVRRLEAAQLIRGYHAHIDPRKVSLDIGAFIGVGIDKPRHIEAFEKVIAAIPDVLECHHVTGRHTLVLKVRTENTETLQRLISTLRDLPGVERTETMIVLETQFERTELPITVPDTQARPRKR
jgi:Lrp/AsnC family leucine-responsive transcriptional regulator